MTKYFVAEILRKDGTIYTRMVGAMDVNEAFTQIFRYASRYPIFISFTVRPATTEEILVDDLKDFVGAWDEYNIQGFAEEIVETVLTTIPNEALIEELERRKEEGDLH